MTRAQPATAARRASSRRRRIGEDTEAVGEGPPGDTTEHDADGEADRQRRSHGGDSLHADAAVQLAAGEAERPQRAELPAPAADGERHRDPELGQRGRGEQEPDELRDGPDAAGVDDLRWPDRRDELLRRSRGWPPTPSSPRGASPRPRRRRPSGATRSRRTSPAAPAGPAGRSPGAAGCRGRDRPGRRRRVRGRAAPPRPSRSPGGGRRCRPPDRPCRRRATGVVRGEGPDGDLARPAGSRPRTTVNAEPELPMSTIDSTGGRPRSGSR